MSGGGGKKVSFKVVVLGSVSVGKTSLSIQYVESQFVQAKATIAGKHLVPASRSSSEGARLESALRFSLFLVAANEFSAAAFHTKSLNINGTRVDLQIWDTGERSAAFCGFSFSFFFFAPRAHGSSPLQPARKSSVR